MSSNGGAESQDSSLGVSSYCQSQSLLKHLFSRSLPTILRFSLLGASTIGEHILCGRRCIRPINSHPAHLQGKASPPSRLTSSPNEILRIEQQMVNCSTNQDTWISGSSSDMYWHICTAFLSRSELISVLLIRLSLNRHKTDIGPEAFAFKSAGGLRLCLQNEDPIPLPTAAITTPITPKLSNFYAWRVTGETKCCGEAAIGASGGESAIGWLRFAYSLLLAHILGGALCPWTSYNISTS
jgi:hypothetical protein